MVKVLCTGGTGFCGFWMQQTVPDNVKAIFIGREGYANILVMGWEELNFDCIVHLANVNPAPMLEYCKRNKARLLYCSSGIIYHPENNTEYRQMKLMGEQECLNSGADVVIARLFTFFGDHLDENKAIVQFERAAKIGKPAKIWGDGSCIRSYMHGSELGKWMWAILLHGVSGEAYDVGSDEPISLLNLALKYSDKVIVENRIPDPMPVYLPPNTAKTKVLLKE